MVSTTEFSLDNKTFAAPTDVSDFTDTTTDTFCSIVRQYCIDAQSAYWYVEGLTSGSEDKTTVRALDKSKLLDANQKLEQVQKDLRRLINQMNKN